MSEILINQQESVENSINDNEFNLIENKKLTKSESKKTKKYIPSFIVNEFQFELKLLQKNKKIMNSQNQSILVKSLECKELINLYKKCDVDWNLSNLLLMLQKNQKVKIEDKKEFLFASKFANLLLTKNTLTKKWISNQTFDLIQELMLVHAKKYNEEFFLQLDFALKNLSNFQLSNEYLKKESHKEMKNIWFLTEVIFKVFITEALTWTEARATINSEKISQCLASYYSFKQEMQVYFKLKQKKRQKLNRSYFINVETYEVVSTEMMLLLDLLKNNLHYLDEFKQEEIINFVSELQIKAYLPDLPPMTLTQWFGLLMRYAILLFWALIILYPVFLLIQQSFNANNTSASLNMQEVLFSVSAYPRLFKQTLYLDWMVNSILIALANLVLTVFLIALTAYAFSRFQYMGKRAFLIALLVTQMIPSFTSVIVMLIIIQLLQTAFQIPPIFTLILIYVGGGVASNTVILKGYMDSISQDIDDAARIDGCSHFWIFIRIIFPLCKPMLVLIALMSFIGPFGDVIMPRLLLTKPETFTIAVGLYSFIESTTKNYASYFAGSIIVAVPIAVLFIGLQKFVVSGMTVGGVKE